MTRKKILELLQEKPLSMIELAKALGKGHFKTLKAIVIELENQYLIECFFNKPPVKILQVR